MRHGWKPFTALAVLALATSLTAAPAAAGPIADYDAAFAAAYADYRAALFQTNRKDAPATAAALAAVSTRWARIVERYADNPPPHLAEAAGFVPMLRFVTGKLGEADAQARAGRLVEAHDTLEAVRDAIGRVHEEAGIVRFSDRMNEYHAAMEEVIGDTDAATVEGRARLAERIGVLAHLLVRLRQHAPPAAAASEEFRTSLAAVETSVARLRDGQRSGDAAAIRSAIEGLKAPYSRLFLKFG